MLRYSPRAREWRAAIARERERRDEWEWQGWRGGGDTHWNLRGAGDSLMGGWEDEVRDGDRTGRGQSGSEEGTRFEAAAEEAGDGDEEEERGRLGGNLACLLPFRFSIKFNGGWVREEEMKRDGRWEESRGEKKDMEPKEERGGRMEAERKR